MTRRTTHITAFAATLLAVAIAAGVSTPRLRTGGRERAARGAALAGSTRPDQPCAWIEPDDDFVFDVGVARDRGVAGAPASADPGACIPAPATVLVAALACSSAGVRPPHLAHHVAVRGTATPRGPPVRLS
ncbi:MAG: hypothetical protein AB7U83_16730 [Vicinamibacterales bacterium]